MSKAVPFSIIIPIYNGADYLRTCVDSVLCQSFRDYELILVDDGSTDKSLEICYDYARRDSRIVVVKAMHGGLIHARKKGMEKVRSLYVGFLDSDDYIDKEMFANFYEAVSCHQPDLVSTGIVRERRRFGEQIRSADFYGEGLYTDLEQDIYPSMVWNFKQDCCGMQHNLVTKLFKKDILQKVYEKIDENVYFGEDALTFYTYCMMAKSVYISQKAYYHYWIHSGSMCRENSNPALIENMWRLYIGLRAAFQGSACERSLMYQLRRYMMMVNTHMLSQVFGINPDIYRGWHFSCEQLLEQRVVLYGAGVCGQAFYQYAARKGKEKNIVAWLDRLGPEKETECLHEIKEPEMIRKLDYDFLVIAVSNSALKDEIIRDLSERYGVAKDRIRWAGGTATAP